MGYRHRIILAFLFVILTVGQMPAYVHAGGMTVRRDVAKLVTPILDTRLDSEQCSSKDVSFNNAERLLGQLFKLQTSASNEALAVLLNFYLGESADAELLHEITKRGPKMLRILERYKATIPVFRNRRYPPCLSLERSTITKTFDQAVEAIQSGKVVGED